MADNYLSAPYIKSKNFLPDPISKNGIPRWADSRLNPKVRGTLDHQKFWEEQIYYILNGYETGGMTIPGRYYYYMNYRIFNTVTGPIRPDMCDLHLELAYLIDYCKANGRNFIDPKGRRKGVSEASNTMIVDYGYRFIDGYVAGIAAGQKSYTEDYMKKWNDANSIIVPEFKVKTLINNNDEVISGYEFKDEYGNLIEGGTKNTIYSRTMARNPNLFKGLYLNDIIGEEMGEFEHALAFHEASKHCLMKGKKQIGSAFYYGTGGKMTKSSKAMQEFWTHAESYNMERFFIPGTRFYFPFYGGATNGNGKVEEVVPNLMDMEPYARFGVEDIKAAEEDILRERKEFLACGDLKSYYESLQNLPLTIEEVFRNVVSNDFNLEKTNNQGFLIESQPTKKYIKYKLEWKTDSKGFPLIPRQVVAIPAKDTDFEEDCVLILVDGHPPVGYRNLFVGGVDSYDQDQARTTNSLGAMVVMRRANNLFMENKQVVCLIRTRPKRREQFYEMCCKVSVYYNLYQNTLIDFAKPAIMNHYKDLGLESYMAKRPPKFQSETSQQSHEYGVSINAYSKPIMIGMLQSYIEDYIHTCWFSTILDELKIYNVSQDDSDNDTVDALGIALMQDVSEGVAAFNQDDAAIQQAYETVEYMLDAEGNTVIKNKSIDADNFYEGGHNLSGGKNLFDQLENF